MKARQDVKGLIKALEYQKDSDIRALAAHFLGELGDSRAVEPLIAALKDTENIVHQAPLPTRLGRSKTPALWSRSSPRSRTTTLMWMCRGLPPWRWAR